MFAQASLGIRQSPRGLRLTLPTFGPSGRQERLNCWAKKRRKKVCIQWRMVSRWNVPASGLLPLNAFSAISNSREGEKPKRR